MSASRRFGSTSGPASSRNPRDLVDRSGGTIPPTPPASGSSSRRKGLASALSRSRTFSDLSTAPGATTPNASPTPGSESFRRSCVNSVGSRRPCGRPSRPAPTRRTAAVVHSSSRSRPGRPRWRIGQSAVDRLVADPTCECITHDEAVSAPRASDLGAGLTSGTTHHFPAAPPRTSDHRAEERPESRAARPSRCHATPIVPSVQVPGSSRGVRTR